MALDANRKHQRRVERHWTLVVPDQDGIGAERIAFEIHDSSGAIIARNNDWPLEVARLGPNEFTSLYSYTAGGKFIHSAAGARKKAESKYGDHV